ncbi:hypothetical protein ILUMI_08435 [Ignelater luminosus]|uniref:pseudouridine 5'-phosphatase n=1 Tax=Ignelater luminosus TaxID=2038154 RepID=A0A8K0D4E3_IGNLU|nr:hypothetical protein ILUMI_08435 [Ignelater luminosus]
MNRACCATVKTAFKKVTHVIFDLDGLLLDTENIYTQATNNIVEQYGKTYDWSIKCQLMGLTGQESAKELVKLFDLPLTWEEYYALAQEQYKLLMPHANLMPGAEKLVRHLYNNQVPIAVATSSTQESAELKTAKYKDLFSLFHHIVTGGSDPEVKHGKPSPDIFLVCASRFPDNPKPEQCLVLEDAPNGVTAATKAGMQCIMVPDPNIGSELTKNATQVLKTLEQVRPELFGLPPLNGL